MLHAPFSIMGQLERLDRQGNGKPDQRYKPPGPGRHLPNTPPIVAEYVLKKMEVSLTRDIIVVPAAPHHDLIFVYIVK